MPDVEPYVDADGSRPFSDRFDRLRDASAKARILTAVAKLRLGLKPDVKPVGEGVHEARIAYGPGYRLYFASHGPALILLLLCGDKRTQEADIVTAKRHWANYRRRRPER